MPQTRQLAAIMFTDIVGYTALMGEDEMKAFEILQKNRLLQKPIIEKFNGNISLILNEGGETFVTNDLNEANQVAEASSEQASLSFSILRKIHRADVANQRSKIRVLPKAVLPYIEDYIHHLLQKQLVCREGHEANLRYDRVPI